MIPVNLHPEFMVALHEVPEFAAWYDAQYRSDDFRIDLLGEGVTQAALWASSCVLNARLWGYTMGDKQAALMEQAAGWWRTVPPDARIVLPKHLRTPPR